MGKFNVVRDYDWTSAPVGSSFRKEAPRVWLKSYKINSNQILTAINGYVAIGEGISDAKTFYDRLYGESTDPEDDFWFPYFENSVRSFSNTFGDTFQSGIGGSGGTANSLNEGAKTLIGGLADAANVVGITDMAALKDLGNINDLKSFRSKTSNIGTPGTYVETPMFYQYEKNDSPLQVSFVLSNTLNSEAIDKNVELVQKLIRINRPLRLNSISMEPPRIYKVRLHGIRYIRWAYCTDFNVELLGAKREINKIITPEAYMISMTLQSLTFVHAGFMVQVNTPS